MSVLFYNPPPKKKNHPQILHYCTKIFIQEKFFPTTQNLGGDNCPPPSQRQRHWP